jgi:tRNA A37 methylthiotransferase MiaB
MAGFCGETDEEHAQSLSLLRETGYDNAFLFAYSTRERTHAARHLADDVPPPVKAARLQEAMAAYRAELERRNAAEARRRPPEETEVGAPPPPPPEECGGRGAAAA